MSIGNYPESLSQRILAGRILVGRLGVPRGVPEARRGRGERAGLLHGRRGRARLRPDLRAAAALRGNDGGVCSIHILFD